MRGLDAAYQAELGKPGIRTCYLLSIQYPQGAVRFTDYAHDLDWDGYTYFSVGGLLRVSTVTETHDLEITTCVVELDAITPAIVSTVLTYDHINRPLTLCRPVLDADGRILSNAVVFSGLTAAGTILDAAPGGSPIVQLEAASHYGDLDQKRGRHTNDESQQTAFPGDRGFEFVTELVKPLIWGRKDNL